MSHSSPRLHRLPVRRGGTSCQYVEPSERAFALKVPELAFTGGIRVAAEDGSALATKLAAALEGRLGATEPLASHERPTTCEAIYVPERDVLSITISPLYRVRHTPGPEAQEVFVMLAEHEAASMLATKDNDGRSLATLISEALVPFRAQIGETIFRAMEPPVSLAAGYTPAADVIRLCMTPVHRQLVLAHLYDDDEMGATEIAGALHMDAGTTYRYLEPLVRWGVLEENSKFQLMAAGQ